MQSALVGFPINYLSLYLNSLVYADFKDFVGGTMPSCLYCTQFNRTGIQVGLISSNGAIMMKSPLQLHFGSQAFLGRILKNS